MNPWIRGLPALAGLLMLCAGLVALAAEGEPELGARALARGAGRAPGSRYASVRALHVMHLALLTIAAALASTAVVWWHYRPVSALVRVLLVTVLTWAVADLAPRLLAVLAPELIPYARRVAFGALPMFRPLIRLAARSEPVNAGIAPDEADDVHRANAREMALGVFSLATMSVSEVMTPRIDIVSVDVADTEAEVIETLRRSEHARVVVFDGHPDAVSGMLHARDVLPRLHADGHARPWPSLIRPAAFVPEGKRLDRQLRDFQRGSGHVAVVVDEFGGTAGLVTLEDILEQIVGEIRDEHDVDEVAPMFRHDDGHYTVAGGMALADLESELGHDFANEDVATVGGLLLSIFGRVPRHGEERQIDQWKFVVEQVARRRIERIGIWSVEMPEHDRTTDRLKASTRETSR